MTGFKHIFYISTNEGTGVKMEIPILSSYSIKETIQAHFTGAQNQEESRSRAIYVEVLIWLEHTGIPFLKTYNAKLILTS